MDHRLADENKALLDDKILKFIRESELRKLEFRTHGYLNVVFIPARAIFAVNSRNRSLNLLKLFLYHSLIADSKKCQIDTQMVGPVETLANLIEAKEEYSIDFLSYAISLFGPAYLLSVATYLIFAVPIAFYYFLIGLFAASAIYNYIEYARVRGELKKRYGEIRTELIDLIKPTITQ